MNFLNSPLGKDSSESTRSDIKIQELSSRTEIDILADNGKIFYPANLPNCTVGCSQKVGAGLMMVRLQPLIQLRRQIHIDEKVHLGTMLETADTAKEST